MGIFSRFNTVLKSNLNSLIDKAEDPDKLISQTISDMEAEVKKAKRELVSTLGTAKRLDKKREESLAEAADWERKATLALRQGDEDLAREALKFKLKAESEAAEVSNQAATQANVADQMKDTLENVEKKIDELKARKSGLAAQVRQARESTGSSTPGSRFGGSSAFDDLDRMTGTIDQLEAEVEAHDVLEEPSKADLDARFRELEKSARGGKLEDELSALKKKLG